MKAKRLWALALAVLLTANLFPLRAEAQSVSEIQAQLDALEAEKVLIDERIAELEGQLSDNMEEMEAIVAQKDLIDQEVFLLNQQITNLNHQLVQYSLLIADKQDALDEAEAHLARLQAQNRERIRAMEKNGSISYWSVVFGANSFVDLLDRLKMIEEIQAADKARLEEMALAAEAVREAKESLLCEKEALERSRQELTDTQAQLEARRAEADALLAELVAKGDAYEALLADSEEEQARLMLQIASAESDYENALYQQWLATQPPADSNAGQSYPGTVSGEGWIVPCSYTAFTSPFGYRTHPIDGVWRMHYGVDLAGPTDTPIYASRSGTVDAATYNSSAGFFVQIDHGDGYKSIYMHMTRYVVSPGQQVCQGQLIGYMGNTGGSKGTHLHFGISYNGTYVNPAEYIPI